MSTWSLPQKWGQVNYVKFYHMLGVTYLKYYILWSKGVYNRSAVVGPTQLDRKFRPPRACWQV